MRNLALLFVVMLVAGCGASAASPPTPTPKPTPIREPGARFSQYPPMTIKPSHSYTAVLETSDGNITVRLLPRIAPLTVNNFVFLARHHYYDHNLFHRILQHFVIQTGDPTGTGYGGPGYEFQDELHSHMTYSPGTLAMANTGTKNTNGSQFFIIAGPLGRGLTPSYTVFGKVVKGMSVVYAIGNTPVGPNPGSGEVSQPLTKVYLKKVIIHGSP